MLRVYGIGDHGGGPTRRDLKRLTDMMTWPLFPTIIFSSYHKFFDIIAKKRDNFPIKDHELNFIFTGCYTTQTRIKAANRIAESTLFEAEALSALAPVKTSVDIELFEEAWRDVLFNQFHDIIPGSGVIDTREHALGLFQHVLANANSQKGIACYAIAGAVDTSAVGGGFIPDETNSEGAGTGFLVEEKHNIAHIERGRGLRRGYLLFNTAGEREDISEFTLWDWPGDLRALKITDNENNVIPFQILKENEDYWGHKRTEIILQTSLPSMGWKLVIVDEDSDKPFPSVTLGDARIHVPYEYTLENKILRVEINPVNGQIQSLIDKRTGKTAALNGGFSGFTESSLGWGSAWMVNRYKNDETPVIIDSIEDVNKGDLRSSVKISGRYKNSKINYIISLDKDAEYLTVSAQVDWLEPGSFEKGAPHFRFAVENASQASEFLYDIPFGTIKRQAADIDRPALSYVCSIPSEKEPALAIISRDKYASRCFNGLMSLTLIRSSYDPDPYPDLCRHSFTFRLAVPRVVSPDYMDNLSKKLNHPSFPLSVAPHKGDLPAACSLLECDASISGIKKAEDGSSDLIIRLYNNNELINNAAVILYKDVKSACFCSITEIPGEALKVSGKTITVPIDKFKMVTIRVNF